MSVLLRARLSQPMLPSPRMQPEPNTRPQSDPEAEPAPEPEGYGTGPDDLRAGTRPTDDQPTVPIHNSQATRRPTE